MKKDRDLLMEWLPTVAGALALGAVVHIIALFAVPYVAGEDAWSRLSRVSEPNRFTLVERDDNGAYPMPFEDPRTFMAVCMFDIRNGPVRVQAEFSGDGLVVMSFHDRQGATFYGLTDRGGLRGKLDALVVTPAQLQALDADSPDDEPIQELRLATPTQEGFVLARSVITDSTDTENARRRLAALTCAQEGAR